MEDKRVGEDKMEGQKVEEQKVEEQKVEEQVEGVEVQNGVDTEPEEKKTTSKKKIIIGVIVVLAAVAIGIGVYANSKLSKVKQTTVDEDKLEISEEVEEEIGTDYLNVAIFGVNAKAAGDKAVDSDAVYVASLNQETKEVKIFSVYGNTLMQHEGKTVKMKEAYAEGGAEEAIAVLNETLELNIKDYVTLNFAAMVDLIDTLGGIEIDVTEEEIPHINGYAQGIAKALGKKTKDITAAGKQKLDGVQATGYCRIRVTDGGDVKRGSRQMEVINKMLEKLKSSGFEQVDKCMDVVLPNVETNFENGDIISYGADAKKYKITLVPAFPRTIKEQVRQPEKEGVQFADFEEIVEGTDIKKDVEDIHKELFPDKTQESEK